MTSPSIPIINHFVALIKVEPFENSVRIIEGLAEAIVGSLGLNVVNKLSHAFSPQGVTLVYVLSESHLAIHSWPELGTIHVDLVTCHSTTRKQFENSLNSALAGFNLQSIFITELGRLRGRRL
ncbi:S-adenosylmethionine decarboxylase [Candidatus Microgenomates bacterium]|nr:S-adenosylmethionine decarboxylase [Candidatus Microgenomates bacterium]